MQKNLFDNWKNKEYKTFSQDKYIKFNIIEDIVKNKIDIDNYEITKNPDKYGIDLLIKRNNVIIGGIEVESHSKYWVFDFPFETVHFLGRKTKFIGKNNFYLMTSKNNLNCVLINFNQLCTDYLKTMDNSDCENEPIYKIPANQCIFGWDEANSYLNTIFNEKSV